MSQPPFYPTDADGFLVYENGRRGWAETFTFVGQPEDPVRAAPQVTQAGLAKARADVDAMAKLMGWN